MKHALSFLIGKHSGDGNLLAFLKNLPHRHSLQPLLSQRLGTISEIQTLIFKNHLMTFVQAYKNFAKVLHDEGLSFILLKGLTLSADYDHPELRPFSDLDFWVPSFSLRDFEKLFSVHSNFSFQSKKIHLNYQLSVRDDKTGIVAEMHSHLGEAGRCRILEKEASAIKRQLVFSEQEIDVFDLEPESKFIYLCQHFTSHGLGAKFLWLVDLYQVFLKNHLCVPETLKKAKKWRCERAVWVVFNLLYHFSGHEPFSMALSSPSLHHYVKSYLASLTVSQPREKILRSRLIFSQGFLAKTRLAGFYLPYFILRGRDET